MQSNFNGERLKKARVYRGLSIIQLAEMIDCTRQTISMYEANKSKPINNEIVNKISKSLDFPMKFFFEKDLDTESSVIYFRSLLTTKNIYREEQEVKLDFLAGIYKFLNEYIDFPSLNLPDCTGLTPEEAAMKVRHHWELGYEPINNIINVVEKNGIIVNEIATNTDAIDAFSKEYYVDDKKVFFIGYSKNKTSAARIHFDVAHELGHICLHNWKNNELYDKEVFKEIEQEAHEFAAAFLLPAKTFTKDVSSTELKVAEYTKLKSRWKTSIQAMLMRAKNLDIISYEDYKGMFIILQKRGLRKEEPLDNELLTSKPSLLRTAVMMLLNEGVFTEDEFLKHLSSEGNLSMHAREIEKILLLPQGSLDKKIIDFKELKLKRVQV